VTHSPAICLALDTALEACSVGLVVGAPDGTTISHARSLPLGRGHAEYLMGELEALLAEAGVTYQDITRLAVTTGPGSFTGLRVGLATARALALALGIPLIGASSLKALELTARSCGKEGLIAATIDARRNQVYGQLFSAKGGSGPLFEATASSATDFAQSCLKALDQQIEPDKALTLLGSGADLVLACDDRLQAKPPCTTSPCTTSLCAIRCPDMAVLAEWALSQPTSSTPPKPLYLRPPDAKPQASKAIARR
jgi:tRNA threonylcarbamoyladenosine biosynthesis protein TsaB